MIDETDTIPVGAADCFLLGPAFCRQCAELFPVPLDVHLDYPGGKTGFFHPDPREPASSEESPGDTQPLLTGAGLVLPLAPPWGDPAIRFHLVGPDRTLLKKFSRSWLLDFQARLGRQLNLVRMAFVDPVTGWYNQRGLLSVLKREPVEPYSLFLLNIVPIRRGFQSYHSRFIRLTTLVEALSRGLLFDLGHGVLAVLLGPMETRERMRWAHQLQRRMKREGVPRVHIASTRIQGKTDLDTLYQALELAGKRGPYGLCDTESLGEEQPFGLPGAEVMARLKRHWRRTDRFALVRLQVQQENGVVDLKREMAPYLESGEQVVVGPDGDLFLFAAARTGAAMAGRADEIVTRLRRERSLAVLAGVAWYPCQRFSRTDVVRNCAKAVAHARFYGPGVAVLFNHLSLNVSGDWYFDQGDYRQAVREYRDGLRCRPGDENLLNSLGVTLMELRQYRKALEAFQRVLDRDPDNYMALVNLGYGCMQLGRAKEAIEIFEKALAVRYHGGEGSGEIYPHLARLYCQAGEYDKALKVLDLWSRADDSDREYLIHRLRGEACLETGQPQQAMKSLQRSLNLYPHDPESLSMLGMLYVLEGEGDEAGMALLEKSVAMDQGRATTWMRLARALLHLGRYDEALSAIRSCRQHDRVGSAARLLHARILAACGQSVQARRMLIRLKSGPVVLPDQQMAMLEKTWSELEAAS